jgi:DNA-binding GntR family transcriptional regulator
MPTARKKSIQRSAVPAERRPLAPAPQPPAAAPLVKDALAERLRAEIVGGGLRPGERIVEGTWGRRLQVAQASIREAIHILAHKGFVTKAGGRSARVVNLSEEDVLDMYELRGALEGLAARLASDKRADTSGLRSLVDRMRSSAREGNAAELLDGDLEFHLELCRMGGNAPLLEHARRVLLPFFAFVRIRVLATGQSTSMWCRDLEAHQRIVDLIGEGEGEVAEQYVRKVMARFAATAYSNWERKPAMRSSPAGRLDHPDLNRSGAGAGENAARAAAKPMKRRPKSASK